MARRWDVGDGVSVGVGDGVLLGIGNGDSISLAKGVSGGAKSSSDGELSPHATTQRTDNRHSSPTPSGRRAILPAIAHIPKIDIVGPKLPSVP